MSFYEFFLSLSPLMQLVIAGGCVGVAASLVDALLRRKK